MSNFSKIFPDKKERTDFWIAITVILLFLAAIIYYLFGPGELGANPIEEKLKEPIAASDDFAYKPVKEDTYQVYDAASGKEEALTALVVGVEKKAPFFNRKDSVVQEEPTGVVEETRTEVEPEITNPIEEVEEELPVYIDEEEEEEPVTEEEASRIIDSLVEEKTVDVTTVPEEVIEESDIETTNKFELEPEAEKSPYGCIVIVGSFKEPSNAKSLASVLEKQNYPVYEGAYRGYYVIGVNADCNRSEILPLLKTLRAKYEKSAWVYKR